jgi:hypothetical protein
VFRARDSLVSCSLAANDCFADRLKKNIHDAASFNALWLLSVSPGTAFWADHLLKTCELAGAACEPEVLMWKRSNRATPGAVVLSRVLLRAGAASEVGKR